jgi:cyclohexadienyl dehydratase
MMDLRSLVLGFATVLAALPAAAESQTPDRLQMILDRGVLRVGTTMDTPVFSMRDPATGKLHGLDMDVLETLNSSLGVKLEYVKMTFGSMLADLAADKFDIAMSGMGRALDRARVATFSKPYMRYGIKGASRRLRTSTAPVSRSPTTEAG